MNSYNMLTEVHNTLPIAFWKITLYSIEVIFIIQLLMVILNYSRNWRDEQIDNSNSEILINNDTTESSQIDSSEVESGSMELSSSDSLLEGKSESLFTVKKILTFISVLPLSSFYLILKLSYNIIKIAVYNFFDLVIYFINYWILNFPERFEEYIINFFSNYIFHGINSITEKFIISFSHVFNYSITVLNKIFSEENFDKVEYYIGKSAEYTYDKIIKPCSKNLNIYSIKLYKGLWRFTKEFSIKVYNIGVLLINTITIFTLDFFEDVQVAWSGIQWFGINIAQPAASFMEDVLLTLTIRPLAYSIAFFEVLIKKAIKLIYKGCIALALLLPSVLSIVYIYISNKFNIGALKHAIHVWMCRWVYLPIWYVVYFLVNYGEKLVIDYIPRAYYASLRFTTYLCSKLVIFSKISLIYIKFRLIDLYQFLEKIYNFAIEYIPYYHKKAMKLSKKIYLWIKHNVFPWIDKIKYVCYDVPLNISKYLYVFVKTHIYSENSLIGKNSRIIINYTKIIGEYIFAYMIKIGQILKTSTINMLKIVTPHVIEELYKIINILRKLSLKLYDTIKPICKKEIELIVKLADKEFKKLFILIKNFTKYLKQKIDENATLIYQSLIKENKKLHQSYATKKEFNKEFLHKNN